MARKRAKNTTTRETGTKPKQVTSQAPSRKPPAPKEIEIPESISVRDLAERMNISLIDVIKHLMSEGIMANLNQELDKDIATMVAEDMGFQVIVKSEPDAEQPAEPVRSRPKRSYTEEERKLLRPRPPVVTVMGHVDHGKTALLDAIRETHVAAGEAGGITQRIGAYQIEKQGRKITFLDTPGHEAFTAMRARGAQATDIAVLVVAADDGVQPQTLEAINHARAAQVPILVAINKIDKANANPDLVKQQLADAGLVVENWGGDIIAVEISALMNVGVDAVLDMILLVADMAEYKALYDVPAQGTVIDARIDRARGPIATVLVHEGTLHVGDSLVIGTIAGKVRAMFDDKMNRIDEALPAMPVVIMGLSDTPEPGQLFEVVEDDKAARALAEERIFEKPVGFSPNVPRTLTLDQVYAQIQAGEVKELNLILKTDIQGSIEPIVNSLQDIGTDETRLKILHTGTGTVSENDVLLAAASDAIIIGFDVDIAPTAEKLAESEGVSIRQYKIIYKLVEDLDKALKGMLEPEYRDVISGQARVLTTFRVPRQGTIAGAQITEGKGLRNAQVRVLRRGRVIFEGRIRSLKRFTEDVREVSNGMEFGLGIDGFEGFQQDDQVQFFTKERVNPVES